MPLLSLTVLLLSAIVASAAPAVLPGTAPLAPGQGGVGNWDGVIDAEIGRATAARPQHWQRDFSSAEHYNRSIEPNRTRFAHIIGARDARVPFDAPALLATVDQPALAGRGKSYDVHRVSWPAFGDVHAEGLLLEPRGRKPVAAVVAVPDCAQTPEQICGLAPGVAAESQFARRLAESGCRALVPVLIDRTVEVRGREGFIPYARQPMSSRELLFRPAFQLGRHLIGYEVQKVLAALIAPRPFMVERGHFDPVGSDEQVGFEFAKVRQLYNARLKLPENCAIEWFVGGHEINCGGTFKFLHRHLER